MVRRLAAAGVSGVRGFALNTANIDTTANEVRYGRQVAAGLGGKPFVVDTSRNGRGALSGTLAWCNPPGRALGQPPTTRTGDSLIDALLWIKPPGQSDGTCNGGPSGGVFWVDYALGLARRAQ
jgi:endoglucanase